MYLTDAQKGYVKRLGIKLSSGNYVTERAPDASRVLEIEAFRFVLGRSKATLVTAAQTQEVREFVGADAATEVLHWRRAFIGGETIMGTTYARSQKMRNNIVAYLHNNHIHFAQVHSFHSMIEEGQGTLVALVRRIERVPNIRFVEPGNGVTLAHLQDFNDSFVQVHFPK